MLLLQREEGDAFLLNLPIIFLLTNAELKMKQRERTDKSDPPPPNAQAVIVFTTLRGLFFTRDKSCGSLKHTHEDVNSGRLLSQQ